MSDTNPIGLFDSGVGGISIMRELRLLLPHEDLIYFADSAHCPYGTKSPEFIRGRARWISDFLVDRKVKMIVVASNTTSVAALNNVREHVNVPVIGVEPAVKPASLITRNGRIGVLATGVTLAGDRFNSLLERFANGVEVYNQPCPGLVELVEAGKLDDDETKELLTPYLNSLLSHDVDVIVLGCTHYPFLRPLIQSMVSDEIRIIDTGSPVAQQAVRVLDAHGILTPSTRPGSDEFYTSGASPDIESVIRLLWGDPDLNVHRT